MRVISFSSQEYGMQRFRCCGLPPLDVLAVNEIRYFGVNVQATACSVDIPLMSGKQYMPAANGPPRRVLASPFNQVSQDLCRSGWEVSGVTPGPLGWKPAVEYRPSSNPMLSEARPDRILGLETWRGNPTRCTIPMCSKKNTAQVHNMATDGGRGFSRRTKLGGCKPNNITEYLNKKNQSVQPSRALPSPK